MFGVTMSTTFLPGSFPLARLEGALYPSLLADCRTFCTVSGEKDTSALALRIMETALSDTPASRLTSSSVTFFFAFTAFLPSSG